MGKAARNRHRLERGAKVYVDGPQLERIMSGARLPVPAGAHLWIICAAWKVSPAEWHAGHTPLDTENMVMLSGLGCYHCEAEWSEELAATPCPGRGPSDD